MKIIVTNHARQRMKERTPFPAEYFQSIAERAFASKTEIDNTTALYLLHKIEDKTRSELYTMKVYSNFLYIYKRDRNVQILVTVIEFSQKSVKNFIVKKKLGL